MSVEADDVAPTEGTELKLLVREYWEDALMHDDFGDDDDFFDIGGHSLLIADIMAGLNAHVGTRIPLRVFFENPTVTLLCSHIEQLENEDLRDV